MTEAMAWGITPEIRRNILAKDCLDIADIQQLMGFRYDLAAKFIRDTKRQITFGGGKLRLDIEGRLHTQDYLDFYNLDGNSSRYNLHEEKETENENYE